MQAKNAVQRIKQFFHGELCRGVNVNEIDFAKIPIDLDELPRDGNNQIVYEVTGKKPSPGIPPCSWDTVTEWIEAGSGSEAAGIFKAHNPEYTLIFSPSPKGFKGGSYGA